MKKIIMTRYFNCALVLSMSISLSQQLLSLYISLNWFSYLLIGTITFALCLCTILYCVRPLLTQHTALALALKNIMPIDNSKAQTIDLSVNNDMKSAFNNIINRYNTAGENINNSASTLAISAAEIAFFLEQLSTAIDASGQDVNRIAIAANDISEGTKQVNNNAAIASEQTSHAMQASSRGLSQLNHCTPIVSQLDKGIKQGAARIQHLAEKAREIENITEVINGIAEQTNLLALNAAIEAARAGEQGRGFAVVADEVRALAARTGEATGQIDTMLKVIINETQQSTQLMSGISEQSREVVTMVGDLSSAFVDINSLITSSSTAATQISEALEEQDATTSEITSSIVNIRDFLLNKSETTHNVSIQAQSLSTTAEQIFVYLSDFQTESMIDTMCKQAEITASIIGERFERAILEREISAIDLFNFKYNKIENTQPQKFSSAFDHFTDSVLPEIQEPLLLEFTGMIYAGAVDVNGYFPTHNKKFSQPLTGNYQLDVNNNRTKRIFDDPTGSRCGAHKQKFLLQTYKRDTGEVLHDVSAPIWVNGKHWGGFRIGFNAQSDLH